MHPMSKLQLPVPDSGGPAEDGIGQAGIREAHEDKGGGGREGGTDGGTEGGGGSGGRGGGGGQGSGG